MVGQIKLILRQMPGSGYASDTLNLHPLCTEHNRSLKRIWLSSLISHNHHLEGVELDKDIEEYGIDYGGPLPEEELDAISIPETSPSQFPFQKHHLLYR